MGVELQLFECYA